MSDGTYSAILLMARNNAFVVSTEDQILCCCHQHVQKQGQQRDNVKHHTEQSGCPPSAGLACTTT
jgi:hypothetical protein